MKNITSILALCFVFLSCNKENVNSVPTCVQDKLEVFEASQACNDGATVKKYRFQNKLVYVYNPGNCGADLSSDVISEDCKKLGSLGGITGNEIINGAIFYDDADFEAIIWKN